MKFPFSRQPAYSSLPENLSQEDFNDEKGSLPTRWPQRTVEVRFYTIAFAALVQVASLATILSLALRPRWKDPHSMGYYPAAEAIQYHELVFTDESRFKTMTGEVPTSETDEAWREAQEPVDGMIEASYDSGFDLSRLQPSVTSAVDNKYHMYGLEVFHNLHCLDRIRMSFYPDHYFPNATTRDILHHREHCLNHIRQSLMCSGDVALDRWYWDKEDKHSYLLTDNKHVCRDFSKLSDWVKKYKYRPEDWMKQDLLKLTRPKKDDGER